jgi:hypothetical protein
VFNVSAQSTKKAPEAKAKVVTDKINTAASLNGEQVKKINALLIDYYKKKETIQADKTLKQKDKDQKLKSLKNSKEKSLESILTPEQLKKWKSYKEKEKKNKNNKK